MGSRRIRIVLAASLLLNLFLAGAIGGGLWLRARNPLIAAGSIRVAGAELPQPQRRAFRVALRATRLQSRPIVLAAVSARRDAAALLRAPALDQAALAAALARARAADVALRGRLEARAVAFAATLPQPERAKLADGMLRRRAQESRRARDGR